MDNDTYLKTDYDLIEDPIYLQYADFITEYFQADAAEHFDCGQGYYQDSVTLLCRIEDKFYEVTLKAENGSQKQDRGDRLYWVKSIESVSYKEIHKPEPKPRSDIAISILEISDYELNEVKSLLSVLKVEFAIVEG